MQKLFIKIDFLDGAVSDFAWTAPLFASLAQLGLDAALRINSSSSGPEDDPLTPGRLQRYLRFADEWRKPRRFQAR